MAKTKSTLKDDQNSKPEQGITKISVSGYKSLAEECSIEIAPLTILSGANSSGKSSIMQPLLLMKQTLESTYDAGSLKINGANVRLTSTDQIFTKELSNTSGYLDSKNSFSVSIELDRKKRLKNTFKKGDKFTGIRIFSSTYSTREKGNNINISLNSDMTHEQIFNSLPIYLQDFYQGKYAKEKEILNDFMLVYESEGIKFIPSSLLENRFPEIKTQYLEAPQDLVQSLQKDNLRQKEFEEGFRKRKMENTTKILNDFYRFSVKTFKCFLYIDSLFLASNFSINSYQYPSLSYQYPDLLNLFDNRGLCQSIERQIRQLIHVPGLRGNPERTYHIASVNSEFTGTFENYAASIIHFWKITKDKRLKILGEALQTLGLTWKVDTKQIDDTQVEVRVGRLKNKRNSQSTDMVSIADVGFGLSQTLPVVVALLVAEPEQLVYLEQPEIHLHPRAQANLAQLLVDAANRGVRVVVETHSELLIRRVQSLIAEDKIDAEKVKLHWFSQDDNGFTKVTTAELDETGAFGDWPEDFSEISLQEESRYLDAAESKLMAV
ncbi:MAG: AAA family ATPase [Pseudanabaena sp.]|jgi:predicted ATPase